MAHSESVRREPQFQRSLRRNCAARLSILLAIAVFLPGPARAQQPTSKIFAALTTDSTAWQRVLVYTIGALSAEIVASATDPSPQPWLVKLPASEPQEQLIRTQLRTILRMRQVMPADTVVRSLEFGPLVITGDTAQVDIHYEQTRKCPGSARTTGSAWSTTVIVPRDPRQKFWGAARSLTGTVGDRLSC